MNITATELKNHLGKYLGQSVKEPVIVEKSGRPSAVVLSYEEFERLTECEDHYWAMLAKKAETSGYLSTEETEKKLKEYAKRAGVDETN